MRLLLIASLVLSACDNDSPNGGGPDANVVCSINYDAGIALPPCNPTDGTGCVASSGQYCVWDSQRDEGACICPEAAPKQYGEACDALIQDCDVGLICLQINGQSPACLQVCTLSDPETCAQRSTAETQSNCSPLRRGNGTSTMNYGICIDRTRCNPAMDPCPANQTCEYRGGDSAFCTTSGSVPLGGDCSQGVCAKGGVCLIRGSRNPTCYEPCDPNAPACSAGTCETAIGSWGVCV